VLGKINNKKAIFKGISGKYFAYFDDLLLKKG
jgi:hypothetical protein